MQVECGRRQRTTEGVRGRSAQVPAASSSASGPGPKSECWEALKSANGTDLRGGTSWAKGLNSLSLVVSGLGKVSKGLLGLCFLRPIRVLLVSPSLLRLSLSLSGTLRGWSRSS